MNESAGLRQVALIVGGTRGIGLSIASELAANGFQVLVAGRDPAALDRAIAELRTSDPNAGGFVADANSESDVAALIAGVDEQFGRLDVLVNSVGATPFVADIVDTRAAGFSGALLRNVMPAFHATHHGAPLISRGGGGSILNIASTGAFMPTPGLSYYCAAKAALVSLTKTAALELADKSIRVNALAPGWVLTEMSAAQASASGETAADEVPLGRWAHPAEIAAAALFLCLPAAAYITGSVLTVDGGLSIPRGRVSNE